MEKKTSNPFKIASFLVIFTIGFFACSNKFYFPNVKADLVLLNGKIVTMDKDNPIAEALAVKGNKILAVGNEINIKKHVSFDTQVIDLKGKLAIPGFTDSHGHFMSLGYAKMRLDLMKVDNWEQIVQMVKEAAQNAKPGEWILGRGWHQEKWDKLPQSNMDGLPLHHTLSEVSPNNPVMLGHASGHSCFANLKAMELAGISKKTQDPPGGEIVKDKDGNPIGVFRETAQGLIRASLSIFQKNRSQKEIEEGRVKAIQLATEECLSKGITSFHDAGVSYNTIELYKKLVRENKLGIRINAMISMSNRQLKEKITQYKILGMGDHRLTVRSIKRLIDGALGSHGAWLLKPYNSLPTSVGLNTESIEDMQETATIAIENGFQLCTHAIGDRANKETLDIYEKAFKEHPENKDLRWRIEHAQHLHPQDIPRFGKLGVIASMQGIHCTSDGPWVFKRLGKERAEQGAYVWRKLMKTGAVICNGTDVPVEAVDPISCFYATVSRKLKDGSLFFPEQKMTREEALRSYTLNGAYASFEEGIKGSLKPGKLADITVLSKDILLVPEDEIMSTQVLYTIVGGKIMYQKPQSK
jgi:predicted amidohydrolase YtcJ